jgi:hypothetical protein
VISIPYRRGIQNSRLLQLLHTESSNTLQVRNLPSKVLEDFHTTKQFLEELRTLVRPCHGLLSETHKPPHDARLDRCAEYEKRVPRQRRRPEVDNEQHETDRHLNRRDPSEMEEAAAKVDARHISGDVVNELAVRKCCACTGCKAKRTVIDGSDKATTNENAGRGTTVKEVMLAKRREELHRQESEA